MERRPLRAGYGYDIGFLNMSLSSSQGNQRGGRSRCDVGGGSRKGNIEQWGEETKIGALSVISRIGRERGGSERRGHPKTEGEGRGDGKIESDSSGY